MVSPSLLRFLSRCRSIPRSHTSFISRNISLCNASYEQEELPSGLYKDEFSNCNVVQAVDILKILQLCARIGDPMEAKACHGKIIRIELQGDVVMSNVLINCYAKCGFVNLARQVFDEMPERSLVSWNTMIGLYNRNRMEPEALNMFLEMRHEGVKFSEFTISSVLCAFGANCDALECKKLHCLSIKACFDLNLFVATALLDLYAKCGIIKDAVQVFESIQINRITC